MECVIRRGSNQAEGNGDPGIAVLLAGVPGRGVDGREECLAEECIPLESRVWIACLNPA